MKQLFIPIFLFLFYISASNAQEEKILLSSQSFFSTFISGDSTSLTNLFVSKEAFWNYLSDSYEIGYLNDTLLLYSEKKRVAMLNFWKQDVALAGIKAKELYKIDWKKVLNEKYLIDYQERYNSGFMFKSYTVNIQFAYKKTAYSLFIDGFISVNNQIYILSNQFDLKREK